MGSLATLPASLIDPGPNDRTVFEPVALQELADSISSHGLAQPPTVRPVGERFEIIMGERRFRACTTILGWSEMPVMIDEMDDSRASALMLAENLQRADLDPVAEGRAYQSRIERFGVSVSEVSRIANVSVERVRERLNLLKLNPEVAAMVSSKQFPLRFAALVVHLDTNRQRLAVRAYSDKQPDFDVFKAFCLKLQAEQDQESMFDASSFLQIEDLLEQASETVEPDDTIDDMEELVGLKDIAQRLGVKQATVSQWRNRNLLPAPGWMVSGETPVWKWSKIEAWARKTGRLPEVSDTQTDTQTPEVPSGS